MYVLAKTCLVLILVSFVSGCGGSENSKTEQSSTPTAEQTAPFSGQTSEKPAVIGSYEIIKDDRLGKHKAIREVLLYERISDEALTVIANKIKSDEAKDFERTFIGYRLKGSGASMFWATSHFNPKLEVNVSGTTYVGYKSVIESDDAVSGEKIGIWLADRDYVEKIIAYKDKGKHFMRFIIADSGHPSGTGFHTEEYMLQRENSQTKWILIDDNGHEFFVVNSDGDLEFWGERGNYYTAPKFEKPKAAD